ncbi:MAG: sigma-54 dependent transcriptional regulator [Planctomycetota bacterium]
MSGAPEAGALPERLAALLDEARRAGALGDLAPTLRAALAELERAAPADDAASEAFPGRFGMIGASAAMEAVYSLIERVAPANVPVLVHGETGTGKEHVARALHDFGARPKGPFLAENCAAVPATLLESVLFGHKKGAFTDAVQDRPGHFVAASGGTLFLDEIGDMPLEMQSKLLRVLEVREVRPVGGSKTVPVDVRVVAATHRDLAGMVAEQRFRQDLYYRLNVVKIDLPPLREREGDVALLVRHFLVRVADELGVSGPELTPDALELLEAAPWPGNVRELENEIRRALTLSGGRIDADCLSPGLRSRV